MNPSKLYIENFQCHAQSYIDFSEFNSALVVGKIENNDSYSNGVGKTTIFKAIEYVLFNQADINLEKIIRDDTNHCAVVMDFMIGDQEYRVSRKRTKKGTTDLTLLQRNSVEGDKLEVYHDKSFAPLFNDKYWKDISGRRAADTEKELEKLIKINFKTFRSIVHFVQNDFSGLTTSTPEKRKALFKDALNLIIYSKLEKIAKDRSNLLVKEIDRHKILIDSLSSAQDSVYDLNVQLIGCEEQISKLNKKIDPLNEELLKHNSILNDLIMSHKDQENKTLSLFEKEKSLSIEKLKIESSIKDYTSKKSIMIIIAKELVEEIKSFKEEIDNLSKHDLTQIEVLTDQISVLKQKITYLNIIIQNNVAEYEELKIPVPDEDVCKHCRQKMTAEHKQECKNKISKDMDKCQAAISSSKKEIAQLNIEVNILQSKLNVLARAKHQIDSVNNKSIAKNKELLDKKSVHAEYSSIINNFNNDLLLKDNELLLIKQAMEDAAVTQVVLIKNQIELKKAEIANVNLTNVSLNKEMAHCTSTKAVLVHNIEQKNKELSKLELFKSKLQELEAQYLPYPQVIQAFSSTGIPNLIIQNVLDELQVKANELLNQLKPGLQLSFLIEKTKGDGTESDTLDIHYYVNGKERYYEQLSGAMKLAVTFSLKIGLNSLLQNMVGTNIKFLLLDEIDQSLDKASVDAFANIVKHFQNDFTILVITHNDRLKDKFNHAILVEQDLNMISNAKVVSEW
jgi:DNA repair exonuclease SbcCD ATPase subunit